MNRAKAVLSSFGLGAGLMFVLDPYSGRRRRALFRDKLAYGHRKIGNTLQTTLRDVKNRTAGLVSGLRFFSQTNKVTDEVLAARIRSKLGRVCSHPSAIEIETNEGHVTLRGPVLAYEMKDVLSAVSSVRGVRSTENKLDSRQEAGNVSGLQGGRERLGEKPALLQTYWSPTTRLLAGAAGSFLTIYGLRQGGTAGTGMSVLGTAILLRGFTNLEMKRLVGLGAGTRAVDINKTINILAPVERVFEFWRDYQNFPKFMSHVREVRETGDHQSHY
jgi:BON domain/Polyketide cyclase / dehydrase and lipid transport